MNMKTPIKEVAWISLLHLTGVEAGSEKDEDSIIAFVGIGVTGFALAVICFCCLRRCFSQNKESPPPYRKIPERKLSSRLKSVPPICAEIIALTDSGDKDPSSVPADDNSAEIRLYSSYGTTVPQSATTTLLTRNSPPPPYSALYP